MSSHARRNTSDSSESDSDSEEEETKVVVSQQELSKQARDDEEDEEEDDDDEEESDTDSDSEPGPQLNAVKKDFNLKAAAKVPQPVAGKRGRDVNGGKGAPVQEPISKKRKDERARLQPLKPASPMKGEKGLNAEQVIEGTKASKVDKNKVGKVENAKPQPASRKRKASPPAVNSVRPPPQKLEVEKSSPAKPKKTAQWTSTLEESLVSLLYKDKVNGFTTIPITKGDPYWEKLLKRLPLEEEMTELQLCEKVKRMKARYQTLKERPKGEGGKLFKSPHEEKIFQIWEGIWGSGKEPATGRVIPSQVAVEEEEESEDESAGTATRPELVSKVAAVQAKDIETSSEDENEEDEPDIEKRTTAGMNQMNADGKRRPEQQVVTPFISKPRLEFTPLIPKEEKRKVLKKVEEVTSGDRHTGDVLAADDGRKGDVSSITSEHLKQLRTEMLAFFNEFRSNCFQLLEELRGDRLGSFGGGAGNFAIAGTGFGNFGMPEGLLIGGNGSRAALELQKKWRKHKIQELALLSERLQLSQEQCQLQQEELKLQNQKLEQQEKLT